MACIINADNGAISGSAGVKTTADSTGVLNIQTNGTTAISISASQAVSFTNTPTFTGGTANGVLYLNGSKVATSGSALTFDGTQTLSLFATGNAVTNLEGSTTNNAILRFRNGTTGALAGFYGNNSKELIFEANGTTEQMRLTSTGLGIGTSSPGYRLHVVTSGTNDIGFFGTSSGGGGRIAFSDGNSGTAASAPRIGANANDLLFYTNTSGNNATERARITSGGNFGIGTTAPVNKLSVLGLISASDSNFTASAYIHASPDSGANRSIGQFSVTGASNGLQINWNHASSRMHIIINNIPTSSAGLPSGTLYSDGGTIKIA